ncbi:hypothetical protein Asp14428_05300 [Actinoplanes sp. NBRC 14428]|nr:hypothetical protein Asp14428_05300 [Actinoplanes sp. NBRC 14428]
MYVLTGRRRFAYAREYEPDGAERPAEPGAAVDLVADDLGFLLSIGFAEGPASAVGQCAAGLPD